MEQPAWGLRNVCNLWNCDRKWRTLTTGTVNFGNEIFANPMPIVEQFASSMAKFGVKPEIEVFETGMIRSALSLGKKRPVKDAFAF